MKKINEVNKIQLFSYNGIIGNVITVTVDDNKYCYLVKDLGDIQNANLFVKGIKLINQLNNKRADYLIEVLKYFGSSFADITNGNNIELLKSKEYCHFIALICDIALHDNKKLAMKEVYHKDFSKYIANVFFNYYIDKTFEIYKNDNIFAVPKQLCYDKENHLILRA